MKISDIDKNFAVKTGLGLNPIVWLDAKEKPFRVHGLAVAKPGTPFLRMPAEVAASGGPEKRSSPDLSPQTMSAAPSPKSRSCTAITTVSPRSSRRRFSVAMSLSLSR